MKSFKKLTEELINEGGEMYPADEMTMKEVKIACYAARNILERLESGYMIQRWQISAIVKASEELASVYTSMSADEDDDEGEGEYVGYEYPSMYGEETELDEVNKSQLGKHIGTVNGYHIHDLGANYPHKTKRFVAAANHYGWLSHTGSTAKEVTNKAKELKTSTTPPTKSQAEMDHDDWRDKQKQRISSGEVRQAVMSKRAKNEETDYKVTVDGLPDMYVKADSPGEVKNSLRKVVKNPEMIKNVERIAKASLQKMFRDKAAGKEE